MTKEVRVYPITDVNSVNVAETPVEVQVDGQNNTVESTTQPKPVTIVIPNVEIYTAGIQGPPGVPGANGDETEVAYAKRTDFISDLLLYRGEANPGTLDSAASWRIRRLIIGVDNDVTEEWADGNSNFDNVWDDRLSLSYS